MKIEFEVDSDISFKDMEHDRPYHFKGVSDGTLYIKIHDEDANNVLLVIRPERIEVVSCDSCTEPDADRWRFIPAKTNIAKILF